MLTSCTASACQYAWGWALKKAENESRSSQQQPSDALPAGGHSDRCLTTTKTSAACLTQPSATHSVQPKAASQASTPARLVQRSGGARPRARKEGVVE